MSRLDLPAHANCTNKPDFASNAFFFLTTLFAQRLVSADVGAMLASSSYFGEQFSRIACCGCVKHWPGSQGQVPPPPAIFYIKSIVSKNVAFRPVGVLKVLRWLEQDIAG